MSLHPLFPHVLRVVSTLRSLGIDRMRLVIDSAAHRAMLAIVFSDGSQLDVATSGAETTWCVAAAGVGSKDIVDPRWASVAVRDVVGIGGATLLALAMKLNEAIVPRLAYVRPPIDDLKARFGPVFSKLSSVLGVVKSKAVVGRMAVTIEIPATIWAAVVIYT